MANSSLFNEYNLENVESYSAFDYGPLSYHEEQKRHADNFTGASYSMVRVNGNGLFVHRLYDNQNSFERGQYFMLDKRGGNIGTMMDMAVLTDWNKMSLESKLWVPPGIFIFVGSAAPQKNKKQSLLGGGLQVFIPNSYIDYIYRAQTNDKQKQLKEINNGLNALKEFLNKYTQRLNEKSKEYLNSFISNANVSNLSKNGNNVGNLPKSFKDALNQIKSGNKLSYNDPNDYPKGTYIIHSERLRLPNKQEITLKLSSRMRYDGATTRNYKSGKTNVTETTHNYTIVYEWS